MIDLGSTDFFIPVPSLPREDFEKYSTHLFDVWEEFVSRTLDLPDYSLALEVEEGSVKGGGRIAVVLGALIVGIGHYGEFFHGLQTIRSQLSSVGDFLAENASSPFKSSGCETKVRKHGGSLAHLQQLFNKVQRREITADQAMVDAKALLGDDAATSPDFMCEMQNAFERMPLAHEQLPLLPVPTAEEIEFASGERQRKPRVPRPNSIAPPPQQLRVEVWRDSKNGKKGIRVVQL
ncbi:MAG: hypothetical protein PHS32_05950 [Rhodoferax sp.]|uniref:hypothetical protein n=1 Tax=Rhodoferax sp. TaxID=50421 RepID=UPI002606243B|nr:hypothetical protein [Rhodoferax sp.]MDD5333273.1 hypothetical protein [Rhodoferax sp.]